MDCINSKLMPLEEALQIIENTISPKTEKVVCPLNQALGRVLAEGIFSPFNVPSFHNSAMDGYAFRFADLEHTRIFKAVGKSFAGEPFTRHLGSGECIKILTGAVIPDGADTVQMQENTIQENSITEGLLIHLQGEIKKGANIRLAGNDLTKGSQVLKQGDTITPIHIGLLASLGVDQVKVVKKVKVAVFSTGNELLPPGASAKAHHIFDSNRPMLLAMLTEHGFEAIDFGIIKDNKKALRETFELAAKTSDCIISSGGVSVGEADYTREILQDLGHINFWKLAIKPGKPLAFGTINGCIFFGLPGNPVSSAVTFKKIALPGLYKMAGCLAKPSLTLMASASQTFRKKPGRTDFQRAMCFTDDSGKLWVKPCDNQSSGVLSSFNHSNCYAVLENQRGTVSKGEKVAIHLFENDVS